MDEAILKRRSIRKYKTDKIPRETVEKIIKAGIAAPSSKNRQPWKFIVAEGTAKEEALRAMEQGLKRERVYPLLPESSKLLKGAEYTLSIMRQAPTVIFIINRLGLPIDSGLNPEERIYEICNAQSIGACIENMSLTAVEEGLGSLWICDIFFAYRELSDWLASEGTLYAALALGQAAENPAPRPRKGLDEIVEWR